MSIRERKRKNVEEVVLIHVPHAVDRAPEVGREAEVAEGLIHGQGLVLVPARVLTVVGDRGLILVKDDITLNVTVEAIVIRIRITIIGVGVIPSVVVSKTAVVDGTTTTTTIIVEVITIVRITTDLIIITITKVNVHTIMNF